MDVARLNSKCVSRDRNEDKDRECFQSRTIACYTRERVKREEKEILQHQTASLCIQLVRYPRIIPHVSIYQPNNALMILHTWKLFLPVQLRHNIRRRNTSSYVLIPSLSSYIIPTPSPIVSVPLEPSSLLSFKEWPSFPWFLHTSSRTLTNVTYHISIPSSRNRNNHSFHQKHMGVLVGSVTWVHSLKKLVIVFPNTQTRIRSTAVDPIFSYLSLQKNHWLKIPYQTCCYRWLTSVLLF